MVLLNLEEFVDYIDKNYQCIAEGSYKNYNNEMDGFCESCNRNVFFKIHSSYYSNGLYYNQRSDLPSFLFLLAECPRCHRRRFINLVQVDYQLITENPNPDEDDLEEKVCKVYKLFSLPIQEESFEIMDIPSNYDSLILTVNEAMFSKEHGKNIASAMLFRRALQIIAKDVLGAKGRTLSKQLEWLQANPNNFKIDLSQIFFDNSDLIRNVANQAAHSDDDIDLQIFTQQDVNSLYDLFLVIINEIFIKPQRDKENKEELIKRRKLKGKI